MWRTLFSSVLTACLLGLLLLPKPTSSQENHCDPQLPQAGDDPYGYRLRGDRCEGVYVNEVFATVRVVSLTASFDEFDPATDRSLTVGWTAPGNESVHLRAYSLRHRLYYQMDSLRPAGRTSYAWATDLLGALNLRRKDLGVMAWTTQRVGNAKRDLLLPLSVRRGGAVNRSSGYQLVLLPSVELASVFISLAPLKEGESLGPFIIQDRSLGRSFYAANRGVRVDIPALPSPGIYYLEIGATLRGGGSASTQVWFYHHGN